MKDWVRKLIVGVEIARYYRKSPDRGLCLLLHYPISAFGSREQPISSQSNAGEYRVTIPVSDTLSVFSYRSGLASVSWGYCQYFLGRWKHLPLSQSCRILQNLTRFVEIVYMFKSGKESCEMIVKRLRHGHDKTMKE